MPQIAAFIQMIVEARDPDVAGHLSRLGAYAKGFAKSLSLTDDQATKLVYGAEIHDIGKLSISESILNKPSRLTNAEYMLIQQHCVLGSDLVSPLRLDNHIVDIILHHHENFDGTGYPSRLAGEEIPLLARIVRIIDSYDAITEDRPYHRGASSADALKALQADKQYYDPDLLAEFSKYVPTLTS